MTSAKFGRWAKVIFAASITLNIAVIANQVAKWNRDEGMVREIWRKIHPSKPTVLLRQSSYAFKPDRFYLRATQHFELLPQIPDAVIFAGDSITAGAQWSELFGTSKACNRGISGDTTEGLLWRVDEIARRKAKKVFILIGINDLSYHIPTKTILLNYEKIIHKIQSASPKTQIFVQSVLPVNREIQAWEVTNSDIETFNQELRALAEKTHSHFVDLYPNFLDNQHRLDAHLTGDGMHLNGKGYLRWKQALTGLAF